MSKYSLVIVFIFFFGTTISAPMQCEEAAMFTKSNKWKGLVLARVKVSSYYTYNIAIDASNSSKKRNKKLKQQLN